MKCERCGGPAPVEGETYRHFWPCGCAVTPEDVYATRTGERQQVRAGYGEFCYTASGLGVTKTHPTREGAIAAWRAALGPYQAPVRMQRLPFRLHDMSGPDAPSPEQKRDGAFAAMVREALAESTLRFAPKSVFAAILDEPPAPSAEAMATLAPRQAQTTEAPACPCACGKWATYAFREGWLHGECRCGRRFSWVKVKA